MIKVNTIAAKVNTKEVINKLINEIQGQADKGQTSFRVQYWAPNYGDGSDIANKLVKEAGNIKIRERGLGSVRLYDGSYQFDVSLKLVD